MSSVDVFVPCYRYGHFLRECVQSVLGETGQSVRVLIIDDASPDNTTEVATDLVNEDSRVTMSAIAQIRAISRHTTRGSNGPQLTIFCSCPPTIC
jgi:glycosyltransferase involved in cell wall biosynthesis